jgi:primosomal protein N' (replication factor Y) (superfamily II helicase)
MPGIFEQHEAMDDLREGAWRLLQVAVERGLERGGGGSGRDVDGALTYKSRQAIEVGRRVEVPLGRSGLKVGGIVVQSEGVSLADGLSIERVKPVLRETGAGLTPHLVELGMWMSEYYVCPLGMVLSAMVPAAVKHGTGRRTVTLLTLAVDASEKGAGLRGARRAVMDAALAMGAEGWPMAARDLQDRLGRKTLGEINALVRAGVLTEIEQDQVRATGEIGTGNGQMSVEQCLGDEAQRRPQLTSAQAAIVAGMSAAIGQFNVHLLRGVTGSGKTEVYLHVLERVLKSGGSGLVLVPEISLTPQTAGRFVERFSELTRGGVAVLHSGLSASQRHKEWAKAASGAARVVVGARSAVFAPMENLRLIVVDEEHASDYKQDQLPRYHGRDVAIKRAQLLGATVVLGSASPALESWANAIASGAKYRLWQLEERVGGGRLPRVEVVDLAKERRGTVGGKRDDERVIGPTLMDALEETLSAGGQAILLLNRRGFASYIACSNPRCGEVLKCTDCDARMVERGCRAAAAQGAGAVSSLFDAVGVARRMRRLRGAAAHAGHGHAAG